MQQLFVVGLGPGGAEGLTPAGRAALDTAEVLIGYTVYIDLLRPDYGHKQLQSTPMMREVERCRMALASAQSGVTTALVCSGDAGVYGMAGPVLELAPQYPEVQVEVVPGLTAALSGGAVLGAPLGHDFCVISLSDLLTPPAVIEKRLRAAAMGDFCMAVYNPSSKKRAGYLKWACEILLQTAAPDTVCGWVRNIGRDGQQSWTGTLAQLAGQQVDMFTTVFVGNSTTKLIAGRMVTPRGYRNP